MSEYELNENNVIEQLDKVTIAKREVEMVRAILTAKDTCNRAYVIRNWDKLDLVNRGR